MEEDGSKARRFVDAYNKRIELYMRKHKLSDSINTKLVEQCVLKKAIEMNRQEREKHWLKQTDQNAMFGTGIHRLSLVSIGEFPTENLDLFHTETGIYPVGYMCRKKYKQHNTYSKKSKDRVLYVCSVDPQKGPVITAEDGREWSGKEIWTDFTNSIGDVEYKSLEEFFGFGNAALVRKIEGLGDVSVFRKYVPLDKRSGQQA